MRSRSEVVLQLENVTKTYLGRLSTRAIRSIDLTVHGGEFVAVVGPSGSGKSTLMNILGLLDTPTTGTYRLLGHDVSRWSQSELASVRNRVLGFIFQSFNLVPTLTARENVELPLVYRKVAPKRRREVSHYILRRMGLEDRTEYRPHQLSGGQQQRVAVARAMVTQPDVLLADEPTGNLDKDTAREIIDMIGQLNEEGRTVVLITHDLSLVRHADRVYQMDDGNLRLMSSGPKEAQRRADG